ncbi:MAG: hypothetical protein WA672_08925 [Candidatus Angelobacter sp.]
MPFKKRHGRYKIPGMTTISHVSMDRVDADLNPEEQTYIRHYLGYADALIRSAEENASSEPREALENTGSAEASGAETAAGLVDESTPAKKDPKERAA